MYLNFAAVLFLAFAFLAACVDDTADDDEAVDDNTTEETGTADGATGEDDGEPINVVVTMPFLPSMVEAVGDTHVDVESIVPQGVDAHTYQPTPGDARLISDADIIFVNGLGLEEFLDGLIDSAGGVDAPVIEVADGLQDEGIKVNGNHDHGDDDHADDHHHDDDHADDHADDHHHDDDHADDHQHDHDHDHDYPYGNPHFWLSPVHGIHYVENIYETLAAFDPDNDADYRLNADDYIAEIEAFDEWAQEQMAQIPGENRFMVTFHDAFPYFAEHYDLDVVGVIIRSPGREPGAQELARLADEIRETGVPAVFIEPQFNPDLAEAIADEAGVQTLLIYSDTPPEGAGYLEMMKSNVENVVEGLS